MNNDRVGRTIAATLVVVASICFPGHSSAQFMSRGTPAAFGGRFIEPDRALRQQISDAEKAIAESRLGDAIITLGDLLARKDQRSGELGGQDFFQLQAEETLAKKSVLQQAELMLGGLPRKGIEIYQLRYGSIAKSELETAIENKDWNGIAAVSRMYLHTEAGQQATMLLGYHHLVVGTPLAAATVLQRLYEHESLRTKHGANLSTLLAGCWYQAGNEARAIDVILDVTGARQVKIDDKNVELPPTGADKQDIRTWLETHFHRLTPRNVERPQDLPVAGGSLARTGYRGSELPMRNERWMTGTTWSEKQDEFLEKFLSQRASSGELPIPTWQPIVVGDIVLARTTEGLMALDYDTGLWLWESFQKGSDGEESPIVPTTSIPDDTNHREQVLIQRVWNDLPFGRISSDGTRAYILSGLGEVKSVTLSTFGIGIRGVQRTDTRSNTLVALEIATEGKLLWQVGKTIPELLVEPELTDTFFLGPPLPVDGNLYVLGEQKGDIFLFCIDPKDGSLQWRQHLVAVETGSIDTDAIRRIGGAMPAYSDGILVCPTGHGAVVAFDLTTRTLRWGFRYGRTQSYSRTRNFSRTAASFDSSVYLQRWNDGTPMVDKGRVLITPVEGDRLYALDLLTGKSLWSTIPREDWQYLAGINNDTAVIAGKKSVMGINIESGARKWAYKLADVSTENVAGRGVFGEESFIFPTNLNRLIALSLETGKELESKRVRFPLGNLVSVRGELLSQSATKLAMARGVATTSTTTEARLKEDPKDFGATVRKGELLLEDGKRDEAIRWLRRAHQEQPTNEEVRQLLVEGMLDAIREDLDQHDEFIPLLKQLAELPEEKNHFLRLMIDGSIQRKEFIVAAESLMDLSLPDGIPSLGYETGEGTRIELGEVTTHINGWIAARINEIVKKADDSTLSAINEKIAERVDALASKTNREARLVQQHFGQFGATDPIKLAFAQKYIREGSLLSAERLLLKAIQHSEPESAAVNQWNAMLASVYYTIAKSVSGRSRLTRANWRDDAIQYASKVSDWDTVNTLDGNLLKEIKNLASSSEQDEPELKAWPAFVHVTTETATAPSDNFNSTNSLRVIQRSGNAFKNWNALFSENNISLHLQTPEGIYGPSIPLDGTPGNQSGPQTVYFDRGLMVAVLPTAIVGVDLFRATENDQDMELFSRPWRSSTGRRDITSRRNTNPFGQMQHQHYTSKSLPALRTTSIRNGRMALLQSKTVTLIDALNGKDIWRTSVGVDDGYVVMGADSISVISPASGTVTKLNADDGERISTHDWMLKGEKIWAINGNRVLSYRQTQETNETPAMIVRLWNVDTGKEMLTSERLAPGVCGEVVQNQYAVTLQTNGALEVWNLNSGKRMLKDQLTLNDPLAAVHALVWKDRLVVMPDIKRVNATYKFIRNLGQRHVKVSGPAMAYNLETGDPMWDAPLELADYGVTVEQPTAGPLMFLSRREKQIKATKGIPSWYFRIAAVDIRSGKILDETSGLKAVSVPIQVMTQVQISESDKQFDVVLQRHRLNYTMKDVAPAKKPQKDDTDDPKAEKDVPKKEREPFGLFEPVE